MVDRTCTVVEIPIKKLMRPLFFLRISYTKPIIVIGTDLGCYSKNIIESLNQLVSYHVNLNYYYLIKKYYFVFFFKLLLDLIWFG